MCGWGEGGGHHSCSSYWAASCWGRRKNAQSHNLIMQVLLQPWKTVCFVSIKNRNKESWAQERVTDLFKVTVRGIREIPTQVPLVTPLPLPPPTPPLTQALLSCIFWDTLIGTTLLQRGAPHPWELILLPSQANTQASSRARQPSRVSLRARAIQTWLWSGFHQPLQISVYMDLNLEIPGYLELYRLRHYHHLHPESCWGSPLHVTGIVLSALEVIPPSTVTKSLQSRCWSSGDYNNHPTVDHIWQISKEAPRAVTFQHETRLEPEHSQPWVRPPVQTLRWEEKSKPSETDRGIFQEVLIFYF